MAGQWDLCRIQDGWSHRRPQAFNQKPFDTEKRELDKVLAKPPRRGTIAPVPAEDDFAPVSAVGIVAPFPLSSSSCARKAVANVESSVAAIAIGWSS